MTILLILASAGLLFMIIGRWLILHEASSLSRAWRAALIFLPFAEYAFALGGWSRARSGVLTCLLGSALTLPLLGELAWETWNPRADPGAARVQDLIGALWGVDHRTAEARAREEETARLIEFKELKVRHLESYLSPWYDSLQKRRGDLMQAGKDASGFNNEAAAYQSLLAVAHEELAELNALKARLPKR